MRHDPRPAVLVVGLVVSHALALAGCSGDVNPMKTAFIDAGYGPKAVAAPDFVAKTRREGLDYMPVGVSAPKPAIRARSSEAQKTLQADLESARVQNEARGRAAEGAGKGIAKGLKPAQVPADAPAGAPTAQ